MAVSPVERQVVYLVERLPPPKPEVPSTLDKIKQIAGTVLAILGMAILVGTTLAFAGHLLGSFTIAIETLHTVFMTGIVSSIAGFHLAKNDGQTASSAEFSAGPLAISI